MASQGISSHTQGTRMCCHITQSLAPVRRLHHPTLQMRDVSPQSDFLGPVWKSSSAWGGFYFSAEIPQRPTGAHGPEACPWRPGAGTNLGRMRLAEFRAGPQLRVVATGQGPSSQREGLSRGKWGSGNEARAHEHVLL